MRKFLAFFCVLMGAFATLFWLGYRVTQDELAHYKSKWLESEKESETLKTLLKSTRESYEGQLDRLEAQLETAEVERREIQATLNSMYEKSQNYTEAIQNINTILKKRNAPAQPKQDAPAPKPSNVGGFSPADLPYSPNQSYKNLQIPENPRDVERLFSRN